MSWVVGWKFHPPGLCHLRAVGIGAFHRPSPNRVAFVFDGPIAAWLEYELYSSPAGESITNVPSSGIEPGQRRLNGPQTTGREYRNLSHPSHAMAQDDDIAVPMRDGINLLADVHRPAEPGQYPVLVAASPYPRQIQNLGAPAGFIEAGATDFFVPRGYVHVIANCRGTSGSGGTFGFFDRQECRDMHDLVEWAAQQPWSAEHPFRDDWWQDRNLLPLLDRVEVPVYLGCDWQNVPLHLPHTFTAYERLTNSKHLQVAMMGEHGLAWPWESLHIEALAWFDHWLKGQDTGILEGPRFRYVVPEAHGWRTSDAWPIREAVSHGYALRADAVLDGTEGEAGSRTYMNLGGGLNRPRASETDPPAFLHWTTPPLPHDLDLTGPIELQLDAACTAPDTAFIAVLQEVDENNEPVNITSGYLRAGLRAVDEASTKPGAPVLTCRTFEAVPIGKKVNYRIPLVPNARRFRAGHKLRLYLTSDDQNAHRPAPLEFRHASIGTSSFNTIFSSSRLLLPIVR